MDEKIVQNFLSFTDKYGLNPYLLASVIVLVVLVLKFKRLKKQKEVDGKIHADEYPTLILGIVVLIVLLIISF